MNPVFKCLIVDDEPLAVELIKEHISKIKSLEVIGDTHNPLEALEIVNTQDVDLLFLDIQMPVLTGIELAKSLKNPPAIIFTTAYRDYAVESYEMDVIDYLVKPITFVRFLKAINKFLDGATIKPSEHTSTKVSEIEHKDHLFVNVSRKYQRIIFNDILYLESLREYIRIFTGETSYMTKSSMADIERQLPNHFLRIHRSFLVNTQKVDAYTSHDVEIGKKEIPIGVSYKKDVQEWFLNH
ncbi:MAG: response regulator transcription factor [Saprospiraceae bacterium]|nr:response regulator transcription factor [Saprospiraceae bacterium]